jgi:uncharacterized membrane protein YhaH (DUF805 family)
VLHFFFGFQGRVRRSNYFWGALAACALYSSLAISGLHAMNINVDNGFDPFAWDMTPSPVEALAGGVLTLIALWSSLALTVKRWHDVGVTGWFSILSLPPYANGVVFLLLCLLPGTTGPNRYGPDPRGRASAAPVPA